jgi:hypothetical protein
VFSGVGTHYEGVPRVIIKNGNHQTKQKKGQQATLQNNLVVFLVHFINFTLS